jgi:hypothetical protein
MLTGVGETSLEIEMFFEREKRLSGVTRHADGQSENPVKN